MKLTSRDKELMILALSLGIVAASWLGGAAFINKKTAEIDAQKSQLQAEYDERVRILQRKEAYIKSTKDYNDAYTMLLSQYPAGISQVKQIMFVTGLEEQFNTQVVSVSYTEETELYTFQSIEPKNMAPYNFVNAGIQIPVTLPYSEWKRFLDYVFSYEDKSTIPDMSATFDPLTEMVSAVVTMNQYAIKGEDRTLEEPKITVPIGTDNIFKSGTSLSYDGDKAEQKEWIKKNYSCYMMLYPAASDVAAKVIAGKDEAEKVISESNEAEKLIITAENQEDGSVGLTYVLGNDKLGALHGLDGETIDVFVLSTMRVGGADLSEVHVEIDNQTAKEMRFAVSGDDGTRPRFVVESQKGNVTILR